VRCLLIEPFPESALNEQAGKMLLENYEEYARHARSAFNFMFSSLASLNFFPLWQKLLGYSMQGMLAITCVRSQMTSVAEVSCKAMTSP